MTTAHSPLRVLKAQADKIANLIKSAESGQLNDMTGKIAAARARGSLKVAVVMDDKVVSIEITTAQIRDLGEVALAEFILRAMKEERIH